MSAPMLTGHPIRLGVDRHSQRLSKGVQRGEGRQATPRSVSGPGTLLNQCRLHKTKKHTVPARLPAETYRGAPLNGGVGFNSPAFWRRGDHPCVSFPYTSTVGVEVQSSRVQANSPTSPAGRYRGATLIMPNGHMRSCPGTSGKNM